MRLFVWEYLCSGAWPDAELAGSLAEEGSAMWRGVLSDCDQLAEVEVVTLRDVRLPEHCLRPWPSVAEPAAHTGEQPASFQKIRFVTTHSRDEEQLAFMRFVKWADAVWIIAPEFDNILLDRCRRVEQAGKPLVGASSSAVALCADKWALAQWWESRNVPTIPTQSWPGESSSLADLQFPSVIKPRYGAGSQATYLLRSAADGVRWRSRLAHEELLHDAIWQPFVPGIACSVGVICDARHQSRITLPPAEQLLSDDGRFTYRGGIIPARTERHTELRAAAERACHGIDGLRGYVGVDLICPEDPARPVIAVEINPRLTTSYIGYRAVCGRNLAETIIAMSLGQGSPLEVVASGDEQAVRRVRFTAAGDVEN